MGEDITPEDHQAREMYARYGLAMYFAQVLESGVKNALVMAQLSSVENATVSDFDETWGQNFKVTMGKLLKRLEPYLNGDDELGEDLRLALGLRNQLAHHFFWDHVVDAVTAEGRTRMIAECESAVTFFQEIDARMHAVVQGYLDAVGTTAVMHATGVAEGMQDLLSDEQLGSRNCGQCHTPMEVAGSERRPFWRCPNCQAVSLT